MKKIKLEVIDGELVGPNAWKITSSIPYKHGFFGVRFGTYWIEDVDGDLYLLKFDPNDFEETVTLHLIYRLS